MIESGDTLLNKNSHVIQNIVRNFDDGSSNGFEEFNIFVSFGDAVVSAVSLDCRFNCIRTFVKIPDAVMELIAPIIIIESIFVSNPLNK
jgi:hypothetical protein